MYLPDTLITMTIKDVLFDLHGLDKNRYIIEVFILRNLKVTLSLHRSVLFKCKKKNLYATCEVYRI